MPNIDFNGDGRDDIIWRNNQTGDVTNWLGQTNGGFAYNSVAGSDPFAVGELVGIGDFNADGRSDTLWRTFDGQLFASYTYADGAFFFSWSLGFVSRMSVNWNVAGTGDFDGDGHDEILWRNDNGAVLTWLQMGEYVFASGTNANAGLDWNVAGTGDFNGDGRDDVLWRKVDGDVTTWLGQANGSFLSNFENAFYQVDPRWQIAGTGDFNGDGRADILWRHESGAVLNWLGQANGGFVSNANANAGLDWRIVGTGDYNGDGRDDVLWRNANGDLTNWLGQADGGFASNFENAFYHVENVWQLQPNPTGAGYWDY